MKARWWALAALLGLVSVGAIVAIFWPHNPTVPFWGPHQAGITTGAQKHAFVAAFDVTAGSADEVRTLLKTWTKLAEQLTQGRPISGPASSLAPPPDTGETLGYRPARLTITFGVGPSLFDHRFGLSDKRPAALEPLPTFLGDGLLPQWSDGDLVVQVCADDLQTAYHALHNLTRAAKGWASPRWVQQGFQPGLEVNPKGPGRNLQGFLDGTVNPDTSAAREMDDVVWTHAPDAPEGGTYLVVRRIRMFVEAWDRVSLQDQERSIGRSKELGEKLEDQAPESHVSLARGAGTERLLRRPFHYVAGLDTRTGQFDSGLVFLAFMKDPAKQFVPIQTRLAGHDLLNEYLLTTGSALFFVLPGANEGSFVGATLLPDPTRSEVVDDLLARLGALSSASVVANPQTLAEGARAWLTRWDLARSILPEGAIEEPARRWVDAAMAQAVVEGDVRAAQKELVLALARLEEGTSKASMNMGALRTPLEATRSALDRGDVAGARAEFDLFQSVWLKGESAVRQNNLDDYTALELGVGAVRRALNAGQVTQAQSQVGELLRRLEAVSEQRAVSAWDVGLLLLREGLEALLVLAGLLAFVGRLPVPRLGMWVWGGAGAGLALSIGVAGMASWVLQGWMASTAPELVEGLAGLAAVGLMVGLGTWLHSKSAVKGWSAWLKEQMGKPRRPLMWALLALVAVLREGAETVLFFWGLAGTLPWTEVAWGFAGAASVLAVLAVALIGGSKRLPLGILFPVTTALISVLAVKVLGQSLTALQAVGWLSQTPLGWGTSVGWLGFTPHWETALPQALLLIVLATMFLTGLPPRTKQSTAPRS